MVHNLDKLGHTEYEEVLLDNISKVVINRNFIKKNQSFWDVLVFKLFEEYYYSNNEVLISKQARYVEIFLSSMFKYKPSQELPEDVLYLGD